MWFHGVCVRVEAFNYRLSSGSLDSKDPSIVLPPKIIRDYNKCGCLSYAALYSASKRVQ